MSEKNDKSLRCRHCGEPVRAIWHLPASCKKCGASFDVRPMWMTSAILVGAVVVAIGVVALVHLVSSVPAVMIACALCAGVVAFFALQIVLFKLGVLKLTNVNADSNLDGKVIHPDDPSALAKAKESARAKKYAGSDRKTRATQAKQLKETLDMVRSIRGGEKGEEEPAQATPAPVRETSPTTKRARCRLRRVSATNEAGIQRMSTLAAGIMREHYDSIIGEEQTDYMIDLFLSPEAIAAQIEEGYEYYFVLPPREDEADANSKRTRVKPVGFVAVQARDEGELFLSKYYVVKEERGQGYGRSAMRMIVGRARKLGCDHVTLHVNRNNYQAILAYEHMGFVRTGELVTDIGNGFVMDDYVYELSW